MRLRIFLKAFSLRLQPCQRTNSQEAVRHISRLPEVHNYWFCARIQLRTPLAVLEKHETIHRGPPASLPRYGEATEGLWVPIYQSSKRPFPLIVDSDIGPIPKNGGDYLPFVKAFRQIIEAQDPVDLTISKLQMLCQQNAAYRAFAAKHAPDFVTAWFTGALLGVPGVTPKIAQQLFAAGYRTVEELQNADAYTLQQMLQVDETTIKKMRSVVGGSPSRLEQGQPMLGVLPA